jgi:carboxymethylenebutenolidase
LAIQWRTPETKTARRFGREIRFGGGRDACTGYMAYSERVGPGVIVVHDFFGLSDATRNYADDLTRRGFTVIAPDLYDGELATTVDGAIKLKDQLDEVVAIRRLSAAARHLTDNWHPRVGVVGFSLGGGFAGELASSGAVEATVVYYGPPGGSPETFTGPLLGHFAAHDEWDSLEDVKEYLAEFERAGVEIEMHVYDAGHWFANDCVSNFYDAEAASLAADRTERWLAHHLA